MNKEEMEQLLKQLQELDKCDTALTSSLMLKRKHLENELLKKKVNQLEKILNEVIEKIKLERKVGLGLGQVYTISVLDQLQNILNKVGSSNE